jgi:hypothetical protein
VAGKSAQVCDRTANARGQEVAAALKRLAIRYAVLAAHREVEEMASLQAIHNDTRNQTELSKLVALANRAADRERDPVRSLANRIRITVAGNADPYLVMGTLVEGMVHTLCARIPNERLNDTAEAVMQLRKDRLRANGMAQGAT